MSLDFRLPPPPLPAPAAACVAVAVVALVVSVVAEVAKLKSDLTSEALLPSNPFDVNLAKSSSATLA